jgi:hypothetical protein
MTVEMKLAVFGLALKLRADGNAVSFGHCSAAWTQIWLHIERITSLFCLAKIGQNASHSQLTVFFETLKPFIDFG